MSAQTGAVRGILMFLAAALALAACGCAKATDATDPDPHYYKGKQFTHKRTG